MVYLFVGRAACRVGLRAYADMELCIYSDVRDTAALLTVTCI